MQQRLTAHNGEAGVGAGLSVTGRSTRNAALGELSFGDNAGGDCVVEARSGDILDGTCENGRGEQPAVVVFDADLATAFVGKLDMGGAEDDGTRAFDLLADEDWPDVGGDLDERLRRGWGREHEDAFPAFGHRGPCKTGETCRLWDFGLGDGVAPDLQDRFDLPGATDVLTVRLRRTERMLDHAMELLDALVGDGDLHCDSAEYCVLTPNIGASQGGGVDLSTEPATNTGFKANRRDRTPHIEDVDLFVPEDAAIGGGG